MKLNILKKCISTALAILLIISICPVALFEITASAETSGYYTYTVSNGMAEITGVDALISGDVTVPSNFGGYPVTSIDNHAFDACTGLTSVTIPKSVSNICEYAFAGCSSLRSVTILNCASISFSAFENCSNLNNVYFSKNLAKIYGYTFDGANNITDIYYEGTEEEWEKVVIQGNTGSISTATVHYNRTGISNVVSMTITLMPEKLFYGLGEALDVSGGKIKFVYDDGSEELVDITADMISGYDSRKYGKQEITVTYKECMAKFTAEIYKTGDIDGDERIGASDITLLRKCLLSVITGNAKFDVNGDGETDIRDLVRIKKLATG